MVAAEMTEKTFLTDCGPPIEAETADGPVLRFRPLYKFDKKDKLRVWYMERQGEKHRTIAGLDGGALITSGWKVCEGKQKRNDVEQAEFEINAAYVHGLKREYFNTPEEAGGEKRFFKPQLAQGWKDTTWDKWTKYLDKAKAPNWTAWQAWLAGVASGALTPADRPLYSGVWFQPKLDGFCCIAQASGLTSREGQPIIAVPHIMEALAPYFEQFPDAVLHGELYNHAFKENFEDLSSILKKTVDITPEEFALAREMAQFHIYDYPAPHARDLPFGERSALLRRDLADLWSVDGTIQWVETTPVIDETHLLELTDKALDDGYEGGIGRLDLPYVQGRTWGVVKIKIRVDGEFYVAAIIEGNGNYRGYAKRVTCYLPGVDPSEEPTKHNTFGAGIAGGQKPRFKIDAFRAEGHKVCTLEYFGLTKAGVPRQGVAIKWHGAERTL